MKSAIAGGLLLGALMLSTAAQAAAPEACNRACLEGFVDRYIDAMQSKTVSPALFARDTKFTENGVRLPLGNEGLWFRISGKGTYKFYVPDVETQQVAFMGTLREGVGANGGTPVAIALRLKIANNLITEVEQLVVRPETPLAGAAPAAPSRFPPAAEAIEKLGKPNAVFAETIPEAKRPSREELIKTANYYFAGLQRNDGKGYYPFTDDCDRIENGMQTTNIPRVDPATGQTVKLGCKKQFEVGLKGIVSRIRDRRFVTVDRERGIVFAFGFFDHENINWTWQLGELFKIENGQIRRIEAVFLRAPYGINSGWSTYEQGMSEEPQAIR
ncbi:MAG: hypothetical protein WDO56_11405 [Gammaproteobacteria bacterium]